MNALDGRFIHSCFLIHPPHVEHDVRSIVDKSIGLEWLTSKPTQEKDKSFFAICCKWCPNNLITIEEITNKIRALGILPSYL
jgi:hypothetical protein